MLMSGGTGGGAILAVSSTRGWRRLKFRVECGDKGGLVPAGSSCLCGREGECGLELDGVSDGRSDDRSREDV